MAAIAATIIGGGLGFLGGVLSDSGTDVARAAKPEAYPGQKSIAKALTPYLWESLNADITESGEEYNKYAPKISSYFDETMGRGLRTVSTDTGKYKDKNIANILDPYLKANLEGLTPGEKQLYRGAGQERIQSGVKSAVRNVGRAGASQGLRGGTIASMLARTGEQAIPALGRLETDISMMDLNKKSKAIQDVLAKGELERDLLGLGVVERGQDVSLREQDITERGQALEASSVSSALGLQTEQLDFLKEQKPVSNILKFLGLSAGEGEGANIDDLDPATIPSFDDTDGGDGVSDSDGGTDYSGVPNNELPINPGATTGWGSNEWITAYNKNPDAAIEAWTRKNPHATPPWDKLGEGPEYDDFEYYA